MHSADIQDRDGGVLVMATLFGLHPFLLKLYADGGYQGPIFQSAVCKILRQIDVEIVKRSDIANGFAVLPKRWIVERTIAWLNRCRRLAENSVKKDPRTNSLCKTPRLPLREQADNWLFLRRNSEIAHWRPFRSSVYGKKS